MESTLKQIKGVSITPLKKVNHPKGEVFHALKCTENSFSKFGEAYFTTINHGQTKGWKKHKEMVMNLVVPVGQVGFYFFQENKSAFTSAGIGNYVRITVQPNIWMSFEGLGENLNLVLNLASLTHDPLEAINVDIKSFPLHNHEVK